MADRYLEHAISCLNRAKENQTDGVYCELSIVEVDMIIDLLKEQEAVRPEREHSGGGTTWWNVCGNCKTAINPNDKFCHECGQAVKWND